jgi:hypothetical protein
MEDFLEVPDVAEANFSSPHYQQQTTQIFIMIDKYLRPQNREHAQEKKAQKCSLIIFF